MGEHTFWYFAVPFSLLCTVASWCFLFFFNPPPHFTDIDVWIYIYICSSSVLQQGLGQLSDPVLLVGLFSQSGNFIHFLNYEQGLSGHIQTRKDGYAGVYLLTQSRKLVLVACGVCFAFKNHEFLAL